ncbi:uncharacterized protein BP5553_08060 [Venustampulla echinocandica]|uniref:Uncharacterized protein n=1 Tax=Venustampulla echinocandica TaxID=2656787 RepID=A0A370TFL7_9HELO|nr:uncharacterized protein BP5553_08060 [Venustampulla echinocandica]RDL33692.1 hypothetical protein BP5553_08060 [Venustampulla echinocandica]
MHTNPLHWHETTHGRWERDIDEPERFYATLARLFEGTGRTFFAITGYVSISLPIDSKFHTESEQGQLVESAFRQAWAQLRYEHPTLASTVEFDNEKKKCVKVYHTLATVDDESQWLSSSFKVINNGQTGDQISNADPPVEKYATLFLITPPAPKGEYTSLRRDIVFRCHHSIIDGIGTLILLNNLLIHAASGYTLQDSYHLDSLNGTETTNLSPSFHVAANLANPPTQAQQDRLTEILAFNSDATSLDSNSTVLSLPFRKSPSNPPGPSQRSLLKLSVAETSAVLEKCKALGLTPTHAFHAGIVLVLRNLQPRNDLARKGRYINYSLLNLRSYCSPPYDSAQHAAAVYHSASGKSLVIDVNIPSVSNPKNEGVLRQEFTAVARDIKVFYHSVQSDPNHCAMVPLYYSSISPPYPEEVPEVPLPNTAPTVSISSLGVIDKIMQPQHEQFTVCGDGIGPWVASDELGTGIGVYLGTWRGQMEISAGYNDAFRGKEEAGDFLEEVRRIVFEALDIK